MTWVFPLDTSPIALCPCKTPASIIEKLDKIKENIPKKDMLFPVLFYI